MYPSIQVACACLGPCKVDSVEMNSSSYFKASILTSRRGQLPLLSKVASLFGPQF